MGHGLLRARARRSLLLAASALSLGVSGIAQAADVEVGELVVTGRLEETRAQDLSKFGYHLEVVDEQRIQDGLYIDVQQVLANQVPGLALIPQSGPFSYNDVSFQGSRTNEVLYLVDGVRISNRLYNTTPPLDTVPAHMVQRIEVLDGGQGLFFGTQAVAGLINIVTRDFTDETHGRVEVGGNTNEGYTANAYVSGSLGPNKLVAFVSRDQADGYQPFPDADYQPSATDRERGYRLTSFGGKYAIDPSEAARFSASYTHTQGYVDFARPVDAARAVNYRNEEIAWAKLDYDFSDRLSVYLKGYWHDWKSHYDEVDNVGGGATDHVDDYEVWTFHDYGLNALAKYVAQPGLELYGGYDLQKYGGHDDVLIIARRNETAHAVFGQLRITPDLVPNLHFAAGARHTFVSQAQDSTIWNVAASYDLTDNLFVRGTVGTAFRLPDAESLFANDPVFNNEIGNPNLKPERSRNLNLSIGGHGDRWTAEAIGFWRETKDLIDFVDTADPNVSTFGNLPGKVKVKGFELVATAQPLDWVSLRGSYTHASTKNAGQQLARVPKDTANAGVELHEPDGAYGGGATLNWVGEVFERVSGFGRQDRGNYAVLDLNAWVRLGKYGRLSAKLENALDEGYFTRISRATNDAGDPYLVHYRGVPRTFHLGYDYSF